MHASNMYASTACCSRVLASEIYECNLPSKCTREYFLRVSLLVAHTQNTREWDVASERYRTTKILARLQQEAYILGWNVQLYCQQCTTCQQAKLPNPGRAPLCNIPIGKPWEMLTADILEVPMSRKNHRYLLRSCNGLFHQVGRGCATP